MICQGILELHQLHEQWLEHRSTYESLKREEALYTSHAGPYRDCDGDACHPATPLHA